MYKLTELSDEIKQELSNLTSRQRRIVLNGLVAKLAAAQKTGKVSYRYDICPICGDVGSTKELNKCGECYIFRSCSKPFDSGFKNDHEISYKYFSKMLVFMLHHECESIPECVVVGGNWDPRYGRPSKLAKSLADNMSADLFNGGLIHGGVGVPDLVSISRILGHKLIVWMPNVPNAVAKVYPEKRRGATLVVSKVMREGYTSADAAKRIFAMHGNAVIEIYTSEDGQYKFRLADALNNTWTESSSIKDVASGIKDLHVWSRKQKRIGSVRSINWPEDKATVKYLHRFLTINRKVQSQVTKRVGERYFGNLSTRCMKLFPSMSDVAGVYVSPRNSDKRSLEPADMVRAWLEDGKVVYFHPDYRVKPSVDTAVQLELYSRSDICFMIHGHAFVKGAPTTWEYFPCGDLREVLPLWDLINDGPSSGAINLKNHGFLLYSQHLRDLDRLVSRLQFENRL